jgi:hypothetical protein
MQTVEIPVIKTATGSPKNKYSKLMVVRTRSHNFAMLRIPQESILVLILEVKLIVFGAKAKILVGTTYSIINYYGLRIYLIAEGFYIGYVKPKQL